MEKICCHSASSSLIRILFWSQHDISMRRSCSLPLMSLQGTKLKWLLLPPGCLSSTKYRAGITLVLPVHLLGHCWYFVQACHFPDNYSSRGISYHLHVRWIPTVFAHIHVTEMMFHNTPQSQYVFAICFQYNKHQYKKITKQLKV